MFRFLMLAFVIVPIIEIWVLIQVGAVIGGWPTISLMILVSAVGAFLVRREGFGLIMRIQQRLASGELPTKELVDGLLVAMAGALMLTPGFVTDAIGLLCLVPPSRALIRTALIARYRDRISVAGPGGMAGGFGPGFGGPGGPAGGPGYRGPSSGPGDGVIDIGDVAYDRPDDPPELDR
ncbi:MAG: FxsA family protein [Actinomycetota bacterium]